MYDEIQNPEFVLYNDQPIRLSELLHEQKQLRDEVARQKKNQKKAIRRFEREEALKPYQAELIQMQQYLERTGTRMIILFEGRDAAGKGGTIRRVTRYMNEKHYRVVALGKPTEEQRTQWFFQKYVRECPSGGEVVLFDRSWYNRAVVEPIFGFCTQEEYEHFMIGCPGFEKDLVRQGTILVKLYFSVTKEEQARRFERRKSDPLRQWKLSEIDVQAQDRWDDFTNQKYEMLRRTNTTHAPCDHHPLQRQAPSPHQRHEGDPQRCALSAARSGTRLCAGPRDRHLRLPRTGIDGGTTSAKRQVCWIAALPHLI